MPTKTRTKAKADEIQSCLMRAYKIHHRLVVQAILDDEQADKVNPTENDIDRAIRTVASNLPHMIRGGLEFLQTRTRSNLVAMGDAYR